LQQMLSFTTYIHSTIVNSKTCSYLHQYP